jgi:hypothetical protein
MADADKSGKCQNFAQAGQGKGDSKNTLCNSLAL